MNRSEFEARLNEVYSGTVTPVTRYLNPRATLCFKCTDCGVRFFGKPSHIVGKEHQRHVCHMPYGDYQGVRLSTVPKRGTGEGSTRGKKPVKNNHKKRVEQFHEMIWNDYTYQQIAQELKVNPDIVKDYFVKEGLI